jgi:threonine/homoserine/homoserine lactone efflux protein
MGPLEIVLAGFSLGFSGGIAPGPLMIQTINQTLKYNVWEGIKVGIAPLLTDAPIIIAIYFVLNKLQSANSVLGAISLFGAIYLANLARKIWSAKIPTVDFNQVKPGSIRKGMMTNLLNPAPYIFWSTIATPLLLKGYQHGLEIAIAFIISIYFPLVGIKIFMAFLARKSMDKLQGKTYTYFARVASFMLWYFVIKFLLMAREQFGI